MDLERMINASKNLVRTGWMQKGIPPAIGETVAAHSFEAAIIAYYLARKLSDKGISINPDHAAVIALFHDAGESVLGDLPKWTTERINKRDAEKDAFDEFGFGKDLFIEFKEQKTIESKIAKISDRLSTYLQSERYMKQGYEVKEIAESYLPEIENIISTYPISLIKDSIENVIRSKAFKE
ncbi:HD family hydrolase [Acidianus sp. HS-5]|uniref:HD domain-containing protein n=1 Tax=Acidianus sp. HS-5 TaxID=2886040 RepID=UPI001F1A798F|nr:HD family hydrolase [Acidianus sp. HS-5]BDC18108.1 phosphohydrolase [Acidianus sp. HS-5]